MTMTGDIWRETAAAWNAVHSQVADDDWSKSTTCGEWDVRALVDHALGWQAMGAGMIGADVAADAPWADVEPKLSAALDDPSALEGTVAAMGDMPKQQVAGFLIGDLLVHTWDLARAIGADEQLPAGAVQATMMGLQRVPEEMLRGPNMFGAPVHVPEGASPQDQLLGFCGRQP